MRLVSNCFKTWKPETKSLDSLGTSCRRLPILHGIVAAGNIIIPLDSGVFAYETMETLRTLLRDISEELKVDANIMCVLLRAEPVLSFNLAPIRNPSKLIRNLENKELEIKVEDTGIGIPKELIPRLFTRFF